MFFGRRAPLDFTHIDPVVIRFALRLRKRCCGGAPFSPRHCCWNFVARSLRGLQLMSLLLQPFAVPF